MKGTCCERVLQNVAIRTVLLNDHVLVEKSFRLPILSNVWDRGAKTSCYEMGSPGSNNTGFCFAITSFGKGL